MILLKIYFYFTSGFWRNNCQKQLNEIPTFKWLHPGRWTAGTYSHHPFRNENYLNQTSREIMFHVTLQETNISPKNGSLKMIFLFPRWDMLISWRVIFRGEAGSICSMSMCRFGKTMEDIMEGHDFHGQLMKYMCCVLEDATRNRPVFFRRATGTNQTHPYVFRWKRTKQGWLENIPLEFLVVVFVGKQELALRYMF